MRGSTRWTGRTCSTPGPRRRRSTPLPIAGAEGSLLLGLRRQPLPGLLQPAGEHQHRPPAPEGDRGHRGAGRPADHDRAAARQRGARRGGHAGWPSSPRTASRRCSSPTAARTRTRTPSGWPGCTPAGTKVLSFYRSYHGNTGAAITSTGDPRRWPNEFAIGHVHFFGPVPVPLGVLGRHARAGVRARARAPGAGHPAGGPGHHRRDPAGDDRRHRRRADPAARLPGGRAARCATGTASSTSPTR